jgi:hypothetical protein
MLNPFVRNTLMWSALFTATLLPASPPQESAGAATFRARLAAYTALRRALAHDLLQTADAADEQQFHEALAAAIQQARRRARPGDILCPDVAARLVHAVREDFARREPLDQQAIFYEVPPARSVQVNEFYPADEPVATVPALLLQQLEPLPPELRYGFLGHALILLDADTRLIIDVVPNAFRKTT